MTPRSLLLAILALASTAVAGERAAPTPDGVGAAQLAYYRDVIHFNAGDADPHRVLAAALLARVVPLVEQHLAAAAAPGPEGGAVPTDARAPSLELLVAAQALAPDDPLVLWASVLDAQQQVPPGQAPGETLQRLLAVDGDNAAAWIEWMHRHRDDPAAIATGIEQAAASRHHAIRFLALARALATAMQRVPLPPALQASGDAPAGDPDAVRYAQASGIVQAVALPSLATLSKACDAAALEDPERRRHCLAVGRLLAEHADSVLAEGLGIAIWLRAADSPAEEAAAKAKRRASSWQRAAFVEWLQQDPDGQRWAELGPLYREPGLEERELIIRALAIAGIAASPPGDWEPGVP